VPSLTNPGFLRGSFERAATIGAPPRVGAGGTEPTTTIQESPKKPPFSRDAVQLYHSVLIQTVQHVASRGKISLTFPLCLQHLRAHSGDANDLTPDLEGGSAYEKLIRLAVRQDPSLKALAEQHLQASSKPRQGVSVAQPPPAPHQVKVPWLRCALQSQRLQGLF
jgi:hypothetical protein